MTCGRCGQHPAAGERRGPACPAPARLSAGPARFPVGAARGGRQLMLAATALVLAVAAAGAAVAIAVAPAVAPAGGPRRPAGREAGGQAASAPGAAPGRGGRPPGTALSAPVSAPAGPRVAVAPAARTGPHGAAVDAFVTGYFSAINRHDYRAYLRLFSPEARPALPEAAFEAGYGSTADSAARLTGVTPAGRGQVAATLTFTSRQAPASAPAHAGCLRWTITLYLVRHGERYVIGNPPAGYYAISRSC